MPLVCVCVDVYLSVGFTSESTAMGSIFTSSQFSIPMLFLKFAILAGTPSAPAALDLLCPWTFGPSLLVVTPTLPRYHFQSRNERNVGMETAGN